MGKPTGFLEYDRQEKPAEAPKARIAHWNEFHRPLATEERQMQGARCMDCGVPFCQTGMKLGGAYTGCPLHNLIPEWNDMIYTGNWNHALERLRKTNNFPEFTGRVCPALCEAACTCGMNDQSVSIRDNEYATIEYAYDQGWMQPRPPKQRTGKRVAVIGSGPAGLAAADQLNHRGHLVTVYEREDRVGGLLMYGIPNMKLEKTVIQRRAALMEAEGVVFKVNADVGRNVDAEEILREYDAVILCCGASEPRDLAVPHDGVKGVHYAVEYLTENTRSLLNSGLTDGKEISAKGKHVVIVGGGDTGNDCVATAVRQGCASVTQIVRKPKGPECRQADNPWPEWPRVNKTDYGQEEAAAVFGQDPRLYEHNVKEFITDGEGNLTGVVLVKTETKKDPESGRLVTTEVPGTETQAPCELLLIAAGFKGCESYVTEAFSVEQDARSNVKTVPGGYAASRDKVFTAGDMHRGQSLVVWGIAEGRACAKEVDQYLMEYTSL